jgi:hypothetical protein
MSPPTKPAVPELAGVEVHGMTRSAFILRSTLAAGAVYGLGAVTPFVGEALAQSGGGDVGIVNYALTLEYLETAFYERAPKGLSSGVAAYVKQFGAEESQHVDALTAAVKQLGGTPAPKPTFGFPGGGEAAFLKLAQTLEDTGVGAYNGAAPQIQSKEVLAAAGSIVQIEARHAAIIRVQRNQEPAPLAFDKPLTQTAVLAAVKPLITGQGPPPGT